ncbi:variable surface protein [Plasmodium gonderi]|uniref:Variable surface protein n=1 Tax=Plasmodium gonderi TaxID=77519 RepID=A0A1Y1JRU3_PLAGO|nr:variable surface protein [Plasmodium gonderi]GAW84195.1 variable surface protein [Plasmodium gonderi]
MEDNIVRLNYNDMRYRYRFLHEFSYWEECIQNKNRDDYGTTYNSYCSSMKDVYKGNNETVFINEICPKSFSYFFDMYFSGNYANYREAGCRYFLYWLYHIMKKHNCSNDTVEIYKTLINKFVHIYGPTTSYCTDYMNKLKNEQLEDLIFLYNTYKCVKNIQTHDVSQDNREYCDILKKIINENPTPIVQRVCDMAESQKSSTKKNNIQEIECSCRSNILNTIATTIIITLLILFFLLFLFKYTSYGSLLRQRIKWIRKKLDNISNIRNTMKPIEVPTNIFNSRIYDMLYNQS